MSPSDSGTGPIFFVLGRKSRGAWRISVCCNWQRDCVRQRVGLAAGQEEPGLSLHATRTAWERDTVRVLKAGLAKLHSQFSHPHQMLEERGFHYQRRPTRNPTRNMYLIKTDLPPPHTHTHTFSRDHFSILSPKASLTSEKEKEKNSQGQIRRYDFVLTEDGSSICVLKPSWKYTLT